MNTIELYKSSNGETQIEVRFENETVWLSLNQISELFNRDKSVISRHLKNIFSTEELNKNSVVAKNATTALDGKTYQVDFYNLDAIISIGYRVNSKQGTQFRIWATKRLKEYLIQGYSINQKRLKELNQLIQIIAETDNNTNEISEAKGLLNILTKYTKSFILLNQFDSNNLELKSLNENITYEGILKSITQTFDGIYLYPTIEEQASNLLYFVIKNHPFSDGNKRIGAFLFVWFLEKNRHLLKNNGENKINDNALIALALLVAQSNPNEKELMIKLICNLINS